MDILKPYLLLACVAFTVGFVGYWALSHSISPAYAAPQPGVQGAISTSTPDLPLAEAKHI